MKKILEKKKFLLPVSLVVLFFQMKEENWYFYNNHPRLLKIYLLVDKRNVDIIALPVKSKRKSMQLM